MLASAFLRQSAALLLGVLMLGTSMLLGAQTPSDTIQRLKGSVVAVGTFQKTRSPPFQFAGTGFVVGDGTYIVTNAHVLPAMLDPSKMDRLPHVRRWLTQTERVRTIIDERYPHLDDAARATAAVEENVLVQLENLRSIPFVGEKLAEGKLHMSGWVFKIETGEVFDYDPEVGEFVPLVGATRKASSSPPPSMRARAAKGSDPGT